MEIKYFKSNLLLPNGSTGVGFKRQNSRKRKMTVLAFPTGKKINEKSIEKEQGSRHETNEAY